MRIKVLVILVVLFLTQYSFGQSINTNLQIEELNQRIESLEKDNEKIIIKVDSINNENIITHYSTVFQEWANIQTTLIGMLSGIGFILTLLTYFFGYKPAKDAEKELLKIKSNIDSVMTDKIEKYLQEKEKKDYLSAIDNIISPDPALKSIAVNFLGSNQHIKADDKTKERLVCYLTELDLDNTVRSIAMGIIFTTKSKISEEYFEKSFSGNRDLTADNYQYAKYLTISYTNKNTELINSYMEKNKAISYIFIMTFLSMLIFIDKKTFITFVNQDLKFDSLTEKEKSDFISFIKNVIKQYKVEEDCLNVLKN